MKRPFSNTKGSTFIELLLYLAIFLVLTPILLTVAINSLQTSRAYNVEKMLYADGQFSSEKMLDLITNAKRINMGNSRLNDPVGKLAIVTQDDQEIVIELNPTTKRIEIIETGVASSITYSENEVEQLFFEKAPDSIGDAEIVLGVAVRMKLSGAEAESVEQDYVLTANLERGDFDNDGCPDYDDVFPRHASCCGDADVDGICDELDNCILEYNPFQEDYDTDTVGDHCDASAYIPAGEGSGIATLGVFNCSSDAALIELIEHDPPFQASTIKQILLSSSPLSPTVLLSLIAHPDVVSLGHLKTILVANVKWTEAVYDAVVDLDLPGFQKIQTLDANAAAEEVAWMEGDNNLITNYQVNHFTDDSSETPEWYNRVKFHTADLPLCQSSAQQADIFIMEVVNGQPNINVTTETIQGTTTDTVSLDDNYIENSHGFGIEFNEKVGNLYVFLINSISCNDELTSVEFDFGTDADVIAPSRGSTDYDSYRYTSYCEGGCDTDCGDVGSGIVEGNVLNDTCYMEDSSPPEWCSRWYTLVDNDTESPSFVGGTQEGEATVYWEKKFKSVLTTLQLANLKSITVTGEVAFQNITQFFCDTLSSSCPMEGILLSHDVELYNYNTSSWEGIGATNLDGAISSQQKFEVKYEDLNDILDFFGTASQDELKARIKFNWDGQPATIGANAPSFMLLDYFTLHLKW